MLIGFSGASGSGKTTLVRLLSKELIKRGVDVGVVHEVAREIFEKYRQLYGFNSLDELRKSKYILQFQIDVLKQQAQFEETLCNLHDVVLTDRTIYDNLLYTALYHNDNFKEFEEYLNILDDIEVKRCLRAYDIIFLCAPLRGDVDDGFRKTDWNYRRVEYRLLSKLFPIRSLVYLMSDEIQYLDDSSAEDENNATNSIESVIQQRFRACLTILKLHGIID